MTEGEFSVYQFFDDGICERVRNHVSAKEAVEAAKHYCTSVGARQGMTVRVICGRYGFRMTLKPDAIASCQLRRLRIYAGHDKTESLTRGGSKGLARPQQNYCRKRRDGTRDTAAHLARDRARPSVPLCAPARARACWDDHTWGVSL